MHLLYPSTIGLSRRSEVRKSSGPLKIITPSAFSLCPACVRRPPVLNQEGKLMSPHAPFPIHL